MFRITTLIFAHRGSSKSYPENTMIAFQKALEQGADGIELDVQLTADGVPIVIHDETLDRTTNGSGSVNEYTLEEIKKLDAGSWRSKKFRTEKIPTLEEVLEWMKPTPLLLNIELKNSIVTYENLEIEILKLVKKYDLLSRTIFSSFNHMSLAHLKQLEEKAEIAPLYNEKLYKPWDYALSFGARSIHPSFYVLDLATIKLCQQHHVAIRTYTVNRKKWIKHSFNWSIDAIFTDVPDVAKKIRDQYTLQSN